MLAVGTGPWGVKHIIESLGLNGVTVACENSPNSTTVSGDEAALDKLAAGLENRGVFNRKLRVDVAYHSSHMQLVAGEYMVTITNVTPKAVDGMAFYSSLLDNKLDTTLLLSPSYWVENLIKPVRFSSALQNLYTDVVVEIGPHSALKGPINQIFKRIS
jgi:acyl transferase domain-containing protein